MLGKLYIVGTPIGNLSDISERAIQTLNEVDLILAEDTRVTKKLLNNYKINTNVISYHQHSNNSKQDLILNKLLQGENIALVTDAGTPGISDPGNELVDYLLGHSGVEDDRICIIPIPGASAVTSALSVCGFNVQKYIFIGFMPKKKRLKLFKFLDESKLPFVYYDSPHRVIKNLLAMQGVFGDDRRVFVARELTKLHEELYRGNINDVIKQLQNTTLKGEITVVVEKG